MNKGKGIWVAVSAVCIVAAILLVIVLTGKGQKEEVAKIGFIMSGEMEEEGWNGMHYNGIRQACERYGAQLLVRENVKEFTGECEKAILELVEEGAGMIILSSYGYSEEVREVVKQFPEIVFYVNSSEYHEENMTSYFVRMYQARYQAGIVAGMKTKSNKVGYVAAMANNEVNRGINAFTLGVKRVNPNAEVVVAWTGEWDNREKEIEAANLLITEEKADVLTYHQNQSNVIEAAEAAGVYSIGYHEALEEGSDNYLTTVVCDWAIVYEQILREYFVGKANIKDNYWIGLEKEAVGLSDYSDEVFTEIKKEVERAETEVLSGKDVFSGIIYDTEGKMRCDEKEFISDELLLEHMDWYVEGVVFYGN